MNNILIFVTHRKFSKKVPRCDKREPEIVWVFHCSCAEIPHSYRDPDVGARYFLARAGVNLEFFLLSVPKVETKQMVFRQCQKL